jgi:hypothetical protein
VHSRSATVARIAAPRAARSVAIMSSKLGASSFTGKAVQVINNLQGLFTMEVVVVSHCQPVLISNSK